MIMSSQKFIFLSLKDLEEEAEDLEEEVTGVQEASEKVLVYLKTVSVSSHANAKKQTEQLAKRHLM